MIFNAISAASGGGGAKIATGSYVGTGTYGSSNPCSLTFDFEPYILVFFPVNRTIEIMGDYVNEGYSDPYITIAFHKWETERRIETSSYYTNGGSYYKAYTTLHIIFSGKTVSWYMDDTYSSGGWTYNLSRQIFNLNGTTYHYLAIG